MKIKDASAQYTGGGVYIYYGQLEDGNYFRACDGDDFIEICNADTSADEADYSEFYEKHRIETLTGYEYQYFWNEMLYWIINYAPGGNYSAAELNARIIEMDPVIEGAIECLKDSGLRPIKERLIEIFEMWVNRLHASSDKALAAKEIGMHNQCISKINSEKDEDNTADIERFRNMFDTQEKCDDFRKTLGKLEWTIYWKDTGGSIIRESEFNDNIGDKDSFVTIQLCDWLGWNDGEITEHKYTFAVFLYVNGKEDSYSMFDTIDEAIADYKKTCEIVKKSLNNEGEIING